MANSDREKRQYERYTTDIEVFFNFAYDIKTKVDYQLVDKKSNQVLTRKYSALSKNVSLAGLCFTCGQKLQPGDHLQMEVVLPGRKDVAIMQGEVRWCAADPKNETKYDSGIKLLTINGKEVPATFHYDENNQAVWSAVLESFIGDFRK